MENSYTVYVHINKANGKRYVGQTKQKVECRWQGGNGYLKSQPVFSNAIKKYGWDAFEHVIIADGLTVDQANALETELIKKYHTTSHEQGYNIMFGGGNRTIPDSVRTKISQAHTGIKIGPCSEERKRKIGDANRGRFFSPESRARMSAGQRGKKYSDATKKQKSEQLKREWALGIRKPLGIPSPHRKAVLATNLRTGEKKEFEYIALAARSLGINRTGISGVLSGRYKSYGGYTFVEAEVT